jgi:hypothetical protein
MVKFGYFNPFGKKTERHECQEGPKQRIDPINPPPPPIVLKLKQDQGSSLDWRWRPHNDRIKRGKERRRERTNFPESQKYRQQNNHRKRGHHLTKEDGRCAEPFSGQCGAERHTAAHQTSQKKRTRSGNPAGQLGQNIDKY